MSIGPSVGRSIGRSVASSSAKTTERIATKIGRNMHENLAPSVFTKVKVTVVKKPPKSGKNDADVSQTVTQKLSPLF